ncbi:MAG TPA: hypothetical protein PKM59_02345 [Thermodesulfobacteriota bacterium]|nr:hypothetical protein [Thermodesulfobacteriota bacterium]
MAWIEIPGVKGMVYVPDERPRCVKKHSCEDCYACQQCSDAKCSLCRSRKSCSQNAPDKDIS